jgi:hypothetical protein
VETGRYQASRPVRSGTACFTPVVSGFSPPFLWCWVSFARAFLLGRLYKFSPPLYFTLRARHVRGAHARKLTPRHRRTASNPGKSPLYPLSFSLSRALTRLRDFFFSRDFLRFAFTHQKIPAPAADRDRTSPVHSPVRVQAATCLSQLARRI